MWAPLLDDLSTAKEACTPERRATGDRWTGCNRDRLRNEDWGDCLTGRGVRTGAAKAHTRTTLCDTTKTGIREVLSRTERDPS